MNIKSCVLLVALCAFNQFVNAGEIPAGEDFVYQVKPGDNLSTLARGLLDVPTRWNEVARYNKLKNSNLITPGQMLRIRLAWLKNIPAEARIESFAGEAKLNGNPAKVGDAVPSGAVLETPIGGSMRLVLPDGSVVTMMEKSNLAAKQLGKKQQGDFFNAVFRLIAGRVEVFKKKYAMGQSPLSIQSRNAILGVRGTHFRMGQEGNNTLAEIEEGRVTFGSEPVSDQLELAGGYGSVADGIHTPQIITLLPRPGFPEFTADFSPTSVNFNMPELPGATGFRGEIAKDEEFVQLIAPVNAQGNVISIPGLGEGRYWLRLRGVDEHGLQGLEGKASFNVKLAELRDLPTAALNSPTIEQNNNTVINWQGEADLKYELQVSGTEDFKLLWITYITQGTRMSIPPPHPLPGHYFMRVRAIDGSRVGKWSNSVAWTVQ